MEAPFTAAYDRQYLLDNMMGPNAMLIMEELTSFLPLEKGMRVLDLGCGMGISSILLAQKYGVTVFAGDLWISPTDNAVRFTELGLDKEIIPLSIDARGDLPFAYKYFDMIVSVDAYMYFGHDAAALPRLLPYLKQGGLFAVAIPGLLREFPNNEVPAELQPFWPDEEVHFYTCDWWRSLWEQEPGLTVLDCREMESCRQGWADWAQSSHEFAKGDAEMMEAEAGNWFNFVQIIGRKK